MNTTTFYMNPDTGSVDTAENWEAEFLAAVNAGEPEEQGWGETPFENLVEVRRTISEDEREEYGEWMPM